MRKQLYCRHLVKGINDMCFTANNAILAQVPVFHKNDIYLCVNDHLSVPIRARAIEVSRTFVMNTVLEQIEKGGTQWTNIKK